jgi:hypothetical protein
LRQCWLDAVVTAPVLAASGSSASTPSFGLTDPSAVRRVRASGDRQVPDQSEGGSCFRVGVVLSRYADALGFLPGLDSARCATVLSTSPRIALALGRMKYQ